MRFAIRQLFFLFHLCSCFIIWGAENTNHTITAVILGDLRPSTFIDTKTGRPSGFAVELLNTIASGAGYQVNFVAVNNWDEVEELLKNNTADVCPALAVSEKRKSYIAFTDTTETAPVTINIRSHTRDIKELKDLAGRPVGSLRASQAYIYLKEKAGIESKTFDTYQAGLFDLLAGHIDAFVAPDYIINNLAKEVGFQNDIKCVYPALFELKRAFGFSSHNTELCRIFNQSLGEYAATQKHQTLLRKWYGTPTPFWTTRRVVILSTILIAAITIFLTAWRFLTLRKLNNQLHQHLSELVKTQDALKSSEEHFRTMFNLAAIGLAQADPSTGQFVRVNKRFCQITGYEPEELLKKTIRDITLPEDLEKDVLLFQSITNGQQQEYHNEKRYIRKDGAIAWVSINATLLRDASGNPMRTMASIEDITKRKLTEEKLHHSLQQKTILLSEIHHRVKNNLQIMTSLLNLQIGQVKNPHALSALHDARARLQSMSVLHETLYRSGKLDHVSLSGYVDFLIRNLDHSLGLSSRGIRLTSRVADMDLEINKAVPCGLILNELLSNAAKHAFPDNRKGEIHVVISHDGSDKISIRVSDTGIGLPENFSLQNPDSLGMTLIQVLTRQLNGILTIHQERGADFEIVFQSAPPNPTSKL